MSIGKKEVKLLIVLGVLVYGLLFYLIFVNNYLPEIKEVNQQLSVARKQEQALKDDLKNIEEKRMDFKAKNVVDERIENYLYNTADVTECIAYMEKLEKLMDNKLTNVKISPPKEFSTKPDSKNSPSPSPANDEKLITDNTDTSGATVGSTAAQKYYEMEINFKAVLNYTEVSNLINYLEGGSRRIRVSKFIMSPPKKQAPQNGNPVTTPAPQTTTPEDLLYDIELAMNMYAINVGDTNKFYEYSRNKFSKFDGSGGTPFMISAVTDSSGNQTVAVNAGTNNTIGGDVNTAGTASAVPDISIRETGYLTAGENLLIEGIDKKNDIFMFKTNAKTIIQLLLDDSSYKMYINYKTGGIRTFSGTRSNRDINVDIKVEIPKTKVNERIAIEFKVINNSNTNVNIKLTDKLRRVNILERSGTVIKAGSSKEKVKII